MVWTVCVWDSYRLKCDKWDITIIAFVLFSSFGIYCNVWYLLKYVNPTKLTNDNLIPRFKEHYPGHFYKLRRHLYICIPLSMVLSIKKPRGVSFQGEKLLGGKNLGGTQGWKLLGGKFRSPKKSCHIMSRFRVVGVQKGLIFFSNLFF